MLAKIVDRIAPALCWITLALSAAVFAFSAAELAHHFH
jgi:hypothetical protein